MGRHRRVGPRGRARRSRGTRARRCRCGVPGRPLPQLEGSRRRQAEEEEEAGRRPPLRVRRDPLPHVRAPLLAAGPTAAAWGSPPTRCSACPPAPRSAPPRSSRALGSAAASSPTAADPGPDPDPDRGGHTEAGSTRKGAAIPRLGIPTSPRVLTRLTTGPRRRSRSLRTLDRDGTIGTGRSAAAAP
ncbi:putative eukaryotic translation initiation factor 4B1 [Iris pallida]|uniref:Eukaryotic translation initiation factor 4B1 n=1 Tax=Iris pallida TaxID=29817 RepID=A0AAX6FCZ5_IRIPA|nr:putative eukaryotic translation initiation factor 4B1 [Iris pallida]